MSQVSPQSQPGTGLAPVQTSRVPLPPPGRPAGRRGIFIGVGSAVISAVVAAAGLGYLSGERNQDGGPPSPDEVAGDQVPAAAQAGDDEPGTDQSAPQEPVAEDPVSEQEGAQENSGEDEQGAAGVPSAGGEAAPPPSPGERVVWDDVTPGQCLDEPSSPLAMSFIARPCEESHYLEAIAVLAHPDPAGAEYDVDAVLAYAAEHCAGEAFFDYVGVPYEYSQYWVEPYIPAEVSWRHGDRRIVCFATLFEEKAGSAQDSAGEGEPRGDRT